MPQVDKATKNRFMGFIQEYKRLIGEEEQAIRSAKISISKDKSLKAEKTIDIVIHELNIVTLYMNMSELSMDMMKYKNESYLNSARKEVYKIFQFLEELLGSDLDEPLNSNQELLEEIDKVIDPHKKFRLIIRLRETIDKLIKLYGENTKWKWSFVEFHGRIAVIAKNILNYRKMQSENDPRNEFFIPRNNLLKRIKELLEAAASKYRDKYELSTREPADMEKAMNFLGALRRIHMLFGEADDANRVKKGIDVWRAKLEKDEKAKEEEEKKKKLQKK